MAPKPNDTERAAEALLRPSPVRATELVAAIHSVNPTGLNLPVHIERRRYLLKSKLQSRLILDFFAELAIELVPKEPSVIGLRYRPQDRDACHAVLAELSEEARSKVQFHLDTTERNSEPFSSGFNSRGGRPARRTSLLEEGREALAEYDFENAKRCFEEALAGAAEDDEAPALALLELLVDHLASWDESLSVEERLEPKQLTPAVRTLLAVAAAEAGDGVRCARLAKDLSNPRLALAFCSLATQSLKRSDITEATRLLAEAKAIDGTAPQVVVVEAELVRLKAAQREPAERELEALLSSGNEGNAEEKARMLLERWPESSVARRVVRDAEVKRRATTLARMERQAQAAFDAEDDTTALALWGEAMGLGATGLEKKLIAASTRLREREQARRIAGVISALTAELGESSLGQYLQLEVEERQQVRERMGEESLQWLETLGASGSREWKLDASTVLILRELRGKHQSAEDLIVLLRPIESRALRLEVGRNLLAAAEAELREDVSRRAREYLQSAQAALAAGDWRVAIELAEAHQLSAVEEVRDEAKHVAGVARAHLESEARREDFECQMQKNNLLEALEVLRAAEADAAEDKGTWTRQRETLTQRLREQFKVEVFKSAEGIAASDVLAGAGLIDVSYGLDDKGEYAYLATGLGPHLFVRKVSIHEQRVVEMVALTTPEEADFPDVRVEGNTLWVATAEMALQLAIDDWTVLRCHVLKVAEDEVVEMSCVTPGGRFLWLCVRSPESGAEVLRVTDMEKNSPPKVMPKEGISLSVLTTSEGPRIWLSGFKRGGRVFSLGGATEMTLPVGLQEVTVGPDGSGFFGVARPQDDDDEETDEGLRVLLVREGGSEAELIEELEDSFNDGVLQVATALDSKVSFVIYADDGDEGCCLVAYMADGKSVKPRWRVRCPEKGLLLQDLDARRVVLMSPLNGGLRCVPLTAEEPDLSELVEQPKETHIPRLFHDGPSCSTGYDSALAKVTQLVQRTPAGPARQRALEKVLAEQQDNPEALAYLAKDLRSWRLPAEAAAVTSVAAQRFPTHPAVAIDVGEEAVERHDWEAAIGALGAVRQSEFSPKKLAHWNHLRGLALFHLNRLEEAREAFAAAGTRDGTGCHVSGWAEWLDAMMGKNAQSSAGRLLELVRKADVALGAGETRVAIELLDVPLVWGCLDVQLAARMASAALAEPIGPSARLIVASLLRQLDSRRTVTLPFGSLAWTKEQLEGVEKRARGWRNPA